MGLYWLVAQFGEKHLGVNRWLMVSFCRVEVSGIELLQS